MYSKHLCEKSTYEHNHGNVYMGCDYAKASPQIRDARWWEEKGQ